MNTHTLGSKTITIKQMTIAEIADFLDGKIKEPETITGMLMKAAGKRLPEEVIMQTTGITAEELNRGGFNEIEAGELWDKVEALHPFLSKAQETLAVNPKETMEALLGMMEGLKDGMQNQSDGQLPASSGSTTIPE
ncbi:MAG: hypothetical protein CSB24_00785 [Deltaproteobacteria bacterium]|nr:MAG: hypothetical protein CSB24_00785 [Deltaproteobacteria bacterium]